MKSETDAAAYCGVSVDVFRKVAETTLEPATHYEDAANGRMYTPDGVEKVRDVCLDLDLANPDQKPPEAPKKRGRGRPRKEEPAKAPAPVERPVVTITVTRSRLMNTQMVMGDLDGRKVGVRIRRGALATIVDGCKLKAKHYLLDTYVAVAYPRRRGGDA